MIKMYKIVGISLISLVATYLLVSWFVFETCKSKRESWIDKSQAPKCSYLRIINPITYVGEGME
jgi:hypothetical protein